jgi:hypothetical protein
MPLCNGFVVDRVEDRLSINLRHVMLGNKSCGQLATESKLEGIVLLGLFWGGFASWLILLLFLAFLESSGLLGLCLCPRLMIMRMRHVKTLHAAILGGVVRTPDVLAPLVFHCLPFLCNLPFGAASFGLAFSAACFLATLLGGVLRLVLIEGDFLCKVSKFLLNLLKGRSESHNLHVLSVCGEPRPVSHHVAMHLIQFEDDLGGVKDLFNNPLTFELVNKGKEFLSRRRLEGTEKVSNEALICVGVLVGLGVDLLKNRHHAHGEEAHVVLVHGPENNCAELFLEMMNLDDCLGFANVEHLSHQDEA